jgi:hypothetical protein
MMNTRSVNMHLWLPLEEKSEHRTQSEKIGRREVESGLRPNGVGKDWNETKYSHTLILVLKIRTKQ